MQRLYIIKYQIAVENIAKEIKRVSFACVFFAIKENEVGCQSENRRS